MRSAAVIELCGEQRMDTDALAFNLLQILLDLLVCVLGGWLFMVMFDPRKD